MKEHATLLGAVLLGLVSVLSYAQAPVPFINQPLVPDATAPGGPQFTLTVNGTGFVSNSSVNWNGSVLQTQFVSASELKATVPAADIATRSTASLTVVNPAPGGGTSNVAFFTVTRKRATVGLGVISSLSVGSPQSLAVGDFNGDGKQDLALADYYDQKVYIELGDGKGNFTLASSPPAGIYADSVVVGDFNRDGKLDLAVANQCAAGTCGLPSTVSILLGDGTGNFTAAPSPGVGYQPMAAAVGDINGDGNLDVVVANRCGDDESCQSAGTVSILLGDGTGNFSLASSVTTGGAPWSVAVGDFNADSKLDLAVANAAGNTVSVLLGDGAGNFNLASSPTTGSYPRSVAVGDFNADGKLDLAVANYLSNTVSVLLGDGTGNFALASSPSVGIEPQSVVVGDFNGDGRPDLAVANWWGSNYTWGALDILLGDGAGNFTVTASPITGFNFSAVVGDFKGDGKLDVAVTEYDGTVSILLQDTPGVGLSPTGLNFGAQLVGTSSSPQPVTLTNTGTETARISKITTQGLRFSQTNNCPSTLPPNGQCTINVIFTPTNIGTSNGDVTIRDNAPNSPQTVPLTGVGTIVTLSPSKLDFGNQKTRTTSPPQIATLTNYGTRAVSIQRIRITGDNRGSYAQTNNCGTSVPAGGSCTISVTFTPQYPWWKTATLEVNDNGGASPQTVGLNGKGT